MCYQASFTPYGEEHLAQTTTCSQNYKLTGYERDSETGLDYAFARYYNSRIGRFVSADPLAGNISDPQSLNRYAYVANNPTNYTDPAGMFLYPCASMSSCNWGGQFGGYGSNPRPDMTTGFSVYDPFFSTRCYGSEGCFTGGYYYVMWYPILSQVADATIRVVGAQEKELS